MFFLCTQIRMCSYDLQMKLMAMVCVTLSRPGFLQEDHQAKAGV